MYLGQEEDEKSQDPLAFDDRIQSTLQRIFEQKSEELTKVFSSQFIDHILESSNLPGAVNIKLNASQQFHFFGFPDTHYLKIASIVLTLWNKKAAFPIQFIKIEGFTDETQVLIDILNNHTPRIHDVFNYLENDNLMQTEHELKELMIILGTRGLMTMIGFRKTTGSQDIPWPTRANLLQWFNKPHITLSDDEMRRVKNPPKLTVGARAWCKHGHRSSEGFWGQVKGTETEKNEQADIIAKLIIDECVWINVHILPHSEYIIECRNERGYGIRWTIKGEFRGFLEPQMEGGHDKKWRH